MIKRRIFYHILFISLCLMSCSRTDLYYIEDAGLNPNFDGNRGLYSNDYKKQINLMLNGHYITSGDNVVLIFRRFDGGRLFTVDDETFEKLTIEIKDYTVGKPIEFDSSNINIYYSKGSSGFASRGIGLYSSIGRGSITIEKVEKNRMFINIDITILAKPASYIPLKAEEILICDLFSFKKLTKSELTPWLGIPSYRLSEEVYRRHLKPGHPDQSWLNSIEQRTIGHL